MKVAIHQPEHLPWLGFFHKMLMADVMIVLDTVQYRRRYFQNRNRIRSREGWQWIRVPVQHGRRDETRICDVKLANDASHEMQKNLRSICQQYSKAAHFRTYYQSFSETYSREYDKLCTLNGGLIEWIRAKLNLDCACIPASSLRPEGNKSGLILDLCRKSGADCYLSGISGRDYLDVAAFADAGIRIEHQKFHHPVYRQVSEPFEPCMSAIDLLFNEGPRSREVLAGQGVSMLAEVFA